MIRRDHYRIYILLVIVLLGFVLYANTLHSEFVFDDQGNIISNTDIKNFFDLNSLWAKTQTRFIPYATLALNYFLGGMDPFGYHLFNVVIHIVTSIAVFFLIDILFATPRLKDRYDARQARLIAVFSSLVFLSHPLQTQAVAYIVQRIASLAALFYILATYFYVRSRIQNSRGYYLTALALTFVAMVTKENCYTLPFMFLFIELGLFYEGREALGKQLKNLLPFAVTLVIIPLLLVQGFELRTTIAGITKETSLIPRGQYFLTQINVLRTYLRLLVLPWGQNVDYDYPLSGGFLEATTFFSFVLLLLILGYALVSFRKDRLISFGIFWFFITVSVESSFIPINDVIQEHRVYLPMAGFCLYLTLWLYRLLRNAKAYIIGMTVIVLIFSFLTFRRNEVWQTETGLWQDALSKSPHKYRVLNSLGIAYLRKGHYDLARECLIRSLAIEQNVKALTALGSVDLIEARHDAAIENFTKALELDPNYEVYNNLGVAYLHQNRLREAEQAFRKALTIAPQSIGARANLSNVFADEQRFEDAIVLQKQILSLEPKNYEAMLRLIGLSLKVDKQQARSHAREYLQTIHDAQFLINVGSKFAVNNDWDMALAFYRKAYEKAPNNKNVLLEFGKFLANYRKYGKALELWQKGAMLYPDAREFSEHIDRLKDIVRKNTSP